MVLASGLVQGIALVSFPAASSVLLSRTGFGLTATQYGFLFAPQVVTAIAASLLAGSLTRRFGIKKIYLTGLLADLMAMTLLAAAQLLIHHREAAYLLLLAATALLGAGFGLTVPALNALVAGLRPQTADRAVLLLNALLGVGTALAPVFTALFIGLGFWWGLPLLVIALLTGLLLIGRRLPLDSAVPAAPTTGKSSVPARFWLFGGVALLYGLCETLSGNWSGPTMTEQFHAGTTLASLSLTAFWAAVTAGRLLFAGLEKALPARWIFRLTPILIIAAYLGIGFAPHPNPALGIALFAVAGLGCAALLPSIISFGQTTLTSMHGSAAGALIACYQIGYATAAFSVSPLMSAGAHFGVIYAAAAAAAALMTAGIFSITPTKHRTPTPA